MGAGSAAVLGVAAGAALLGSAYGALTAEARRAAEAQQKLNDELDRAAVARNPLPGLAAAAGDLNRQLEAANAQLARLQGITIPIVDRFGEERGRQAIDNGEEIRRIEAERLQILTRMGEVGNQLQQVFANTPAARQLADAARDEAQARERAAEAAKRTLEAVLAMQHALRVTQAGGGNLTAGAGGLNIPSSIDIPVILRPALQRELNGTAEGDELQREFERAREEGERLNEEVHRLTRGLDQVAGAAANVGLIGEEAAQAIGSVLDLADAVGNLIESASAGNVLGLIGAGIGFLGGLVGPSETEREHNRIIQENTEAIKRLTEAQLPALGQADLDAAKAGLDAVLDTERGRRALERAGFGRPKIGFDASELEEQLEAAGTSLEELDRIARANGIQLLDSKGHVVATEMERLRAAFAAGLITADSFTEAMAQATQQLINIPHGFRQSSLAFEAQDPHGGLPTITRSPWHPSIPGHDGSQLPSFDQSTTVTMHFSEGSVVVPIDSRGKDPEAMAREVLVAFRRIAMAESGNPDTLPSGT